MTILFSNNASTTISGSITALDTTVALAAGSGVIFPHPTGADYFVCTFYDQATKTINEIVHVTNVTGDVVTIVRAQEGTTARAWNTGDIFANLITAGTLNAFVQAGTGPANTSLIYVGQDVGTINHIIANTNPVPSSLAVGMVFVIRVANINNAATDLALNGLPAHPIKYTDGSDFIGEDVITGLEYIFIWNGTNFTATLMNAVRRPPQFVFYIRSDSLSTVNMTTGLETNSGLANTPQDAFKTIQGAANTIESRYISTHAITLSVADGTYIGGLKHASQYVTQYILQGNDANPSNCVIDATSSNPSTYVPNAPHGGCVFAYTTGNIICHGFTFKSYSVQAEAWDGRLEVYNINFTSPTSGQTSCIASVVAGNVLVWGNCTFTANTNIPEIFECAYSATMALGSPPSYAATGGKVLNWTFSGAPNANYVMNIYNAAVLDVTNNGYVTVAGTRSGAPEYVVSTAGGIGYMNPVGGGLFSSVPGITYAPGWSINGNG